MDTPDITGAFTATVRCFERIQVGRQAASDLKLHRVQLDIVQVRLGRWGQVAGITGATTSRWTILGCDNDTVSNTEEILNEISSMCEQAEEEYNEAVGAAEGLDLAAEDEQRASGWMIRLRQSVRKGLQPSMQATGGKWTLHTKELFDDFISNVSSNLGNLENILPPKQQSVLAELARTQAVSITDWNLRNLMKVTPECDRLLHDAAGQVLERRAGEARADEVMEAERKVREAERREVERREAERRADPVETIRSSVRAGTNSGFQLGNMMGGSITTNMNHGPITTHTNHGPKTTHANYGTQNGNNYGTQNGGNNYGTQNGTSNYGMHNGNRYHGYRPKGDVV